jgi:hypothetical protein
MRGARVREERVVDRKSFSRDASRPMTVLRSQCFQVFAALVALFAFGADVMDEISDRVQRANCSQTSQPTGPHNGNLPGNGSQHHDEAAATPTVMVAPDLQIGPVSIAGAEDEPAPSSLPGSIDHPPQLA